MVNEEITIIVVSVLCVVIVIAGIIAVSVYFCCGKSKNRRKPPKRYQLPQPEPNNIQPSPVPQDEAAPKSLPKVGSSGLWMTKPVMLAQGPNDAYHQLKPNGVRNEPVMMREILSTPNVNQPTSGYIYQGNLRMYHSQQIPNMVSGYGEHPRAYYNEAFIYPTYVDAGLSHRSSMRFLEASGYYAQPRESRSRDSSLHPGKRDSRLSRNQSDIQQSGAKPARFQPKLSQHEDRRSRAAESEANSQSSSKNKSVSSSTASGVESVIERPVAQEATNSAAAAVTAAVSSTNANDSSQRDTSGEYVRTQADGKTKAEIATPSTSRQPEHENITLDSIHRAREQRDIPSDQQSYVDSVSDVTDMESKGQKITTQAFEFLDTYISDADEEVERPKYISKRS